MVRRMLSGLVVLGAVGGCTRPTPTPELGSQLQMLLDSTYAAAPEVPGLLLRVEAPAIGLVWSSAVGKFDRATGELLKPEHMFRTASNTKTYVAAAILRLVEDGRLGLDAPISQYVLPATSAKLKRGGYDPAAITVRMLLHHTSGLFDYAMTPAYAARILGDYGHRWTRAEQLAFAVDSGKPYGTPDQVYHYSDTGYILLGEILEQLTGRSMPQAVRELLEFDRHQIRFTYFETLEPAPPGTPARAHQYLDSLDTYTLDASHDLYGGGGLVSNLEDMARFYRALVRGEVFHRKETLALMLAATPQSERERAGGYGMGIGRGDYDGITCYGHSGFWGTTARYCPSIDLTLTASINRSHDSSSVVAAMVGKAIALVAARLPKPKDDAPPGAAVSVPAPVTTTEAVTAGWCKQVPRQANLAFKRAAVTNDWFDVYQVEPDVFALVEANQFQEAISYLIVGTTKALMFDTGLGVVPIRPVVEQLTKLPIEVINSHTHYDHVGGNPEFDRILAVETRYTRANQKGFPHAELASEVAPASFCHGPPPAADTANFRTRPWARARTIADGDTVDLGDRVIEILQVPGHTPDALALLDRKNGLLWTGDTYYDGALWLYVPETDLDQYERSMTRLSALAPSLKRLLPAHNTVSAIPARLGQALEAIRQVRAGKVAGVDQPGNRRVFTFAGFSILTAPPLLAGNKGDQTKGGSGLTGWP